MLPNFLSVVEEIEKWMTMVGSLKVIYVYAVIGRGFHLDQQWILSDKKVHMLLMLVLDPVCNKKFFNHVCKR